VITSLGDNSDKLLCAVLFDLDDTLYPEREYVISGIAAVTDFMSSHIFGTVGRDEIHRQLIALLDESRENLFDRLLNKFQIHSHSLLATLVHVYRTHSPTLSLCSDVLPAFRCLRDAGIRLGIVTDGKATMQWNKLEALGLMNLVDTVVCTDDLFSGCGKPSPLPFEVALHHLCVPAETAIYIADDLSKDFIGPRQLGMGTIRLDRGHPHPLQPRTDFPQSHQADTVCRDLDQAVNWLLNERTPS